MTEPDLRGRTAEIDRLRKEAASCRRCDLWVNATQTVFGEGAADADILFVGEQPGDRRARERLSIGVLDSRPSVP